MSDPKSISHKYFTKCKKKITQRPKTGYSNLFHHIQTQHPDYQKESINQGTLPFAQVSKSQITFILGWNGCAVGWNLSNLWKTLWLENLQPLSPLQSILWKSISKEWRKKAVETKIENELPEKSEEIVWSLVIHELNSLFGAPILFLNLAVLHEEKSN